MYSRSAKGGEKGDPNRNPWLAKMLSPVLWEILSYETTIWITGNLPIFTCPIACDLQKSLLLISKPRVV
jgi:hypothetical protein